MKRYWYTPGQTVLQTIMLFMPFLFFYFLFLEACETWSNLEKLLRWPRRRENTRVHVTTVRDVSEPVVVTWSLSSHLKDSWYLFMRPCGHACWRLALCASQQTEMCLPHDFYSKNTTWADACFCPGSLSVFLPSKVLIKPQWMWMCSKWWWMAASLSFACRKLDQLSGVHESARLLVKNMFQQIWWKVFRWIPL